MFLIEDDKETFEEIIGHIAVLKEEGFFSGRLGKPLFTGSKYCLVMFFDEVYFEVDHAKCKELLEKTNLIAVPVLTLHALAKVSMGISDSVVEKAMAECITSGKSLLLNIEGCIPRNASFAADTPYVAMIVKYLRTIADYGCDITCRRLFVQALLARIRKAGNVRQIEQEVSINNQLISEVDIARAYWLYPDYYWGSKQSYGSSLSPCKPKRHSSAQKIELN